jgi:hypothetical protein
MLMIMLLMVMMVVGGYLSSTAIPSLEIIISATNCIKE